MKHWVNTVSRDHVDVGCAGGFAQADHGKNTRLMQLQKGDALVFYSPRSAMKSGEKVQAFTAVGSIADDEPYQVEMTADFRPWRRAVSFYAHVEAPIRPLLDELAFITDKTRWGFPFRRGLFEISPQDFLIIAQAMHAAEPFDVAAQGSVPTIEHL